MVALGAGVTNRQSGQPGHIRTTIDQTVLLNDVCLLEKGKKTALSAGVHTWKISGKNTPWLVQEGQFAYRVLPEYSRKAFVACETRPANWVLHNKTNAGKKNLPDSVKILRLWIDHGQAPVDDTYGYTVYTGKGTPSARLPFRVLRNDSLVQAVQSADKKLLQAVFYPGNNGLQAGGVSLTASEPCTVMIKTVAGKSVFTVTDACMNAALKKITLTYNGETIDVPMPQGEFCGRTVSYELP